MSSIVAFFDMDYTVLTDSSGLLYKRYLWQRREVARSAMLRAGWHAALYKLGLLNYPRMRARLASALSDNLEATMIDFCERWFDDIVVPHVAEKAARRMDEHRALGHLVTIISASTPYAVGPVARYLGVDDYLCTRLEVINGRFTGNYVEPPCYGEGKVCWARQYALKHGVDLAQAYFYSDSHSDLALLEKVGHPVAVNPDPRLGSIARQRSWPVEFFY